MRGATCLRRNCGPGSREEAVAQRGGGEDEAGARGAERCDARAARGGVAAQGEREDAKEGAGGRGDGGGEQEDGAAQLERERERRAAEEGEGEGGRERESRTKGGEERVGWRGGRGVSWHCGEEGDARAGGATRRAEKGGLL